MNDALELIKLMLSQPFMQRAIIGGVLLSLSASLLGVSLVLKKYSMIGDGLSHVGFGSVTVAAAVGFAPLAVAIPVVVIAAFLLLRLGKNAKMGGDAAVALVSTGALAVGVMASSLSGGMNQDFNSYMFGTILGLSTFDVYLSIAVSVPTLLLFIIFYNKIFGMTFDEDFSKATGVNVSFYNGIVAVLTSLVIVLGMRLMGAMLISGLIIFPSLTAMRLCKKWKSTVICAGAVSVLCFISGIIISVLFDTPTGASIVMANIACFGVFWGISKLR